MTTQNDRLIASGFILPVPAKPKAAYLPITRTGNLMFVSGQISEHQGEIIKGRLGDNMDLVQGQSAAQYAALNVLSQIVYTGGIPLDKITKLVKIMVLVSSTADFTEQHLVANGGSELFAQILGEAGTHARSAFGAAALPLGAAVEIEAIVEVTD